MSYYQCSPIPPEHEVFDFTGLIRILQELENTVVKSLVVCRLIVSVEHA